VGLATPTPRTLPYLSAFQPRALALWASLSIPFHLSQFTPAQVRRAQRTSSRCTAYLQSHQGVLRTLPAINSCTPPPAVHRHRHMTDDWRRRYKFLSRLSWRPAHVARYTSDRIVISACCVRAPWYITVIALLCPRPRYGSIKHWCDPYIRLAVRPSVCHTPLHRQQCILGPVSTEHWWENPRRTRTSGHRGIAVRPPEVAEMATKLHKHSLNGCTVDICSRRTAVGGTYRFARRCSFQLESIRSDIGIRHLSSVLYFDKQYVNYLFSGVSSCPFMCSLKYSLLFFYKCCKPAMLGWSYY